MRRDPSSLAEHFEANPDDAAAFIILEEHHYLHGDWSALVALYERRLEAPALEATPQRRAALLFRMGQVLEERCVAVDRAVECYQDVARFDPGFRPALTQLRRIHLSREHWDLALQAAELEAALPLAPYEQAAFAAEMGELWERRLGDSDQGLAWFARALEADPEHPGALLGAARIHEQQGRPQQAAEALERVLGRLSGPDRAPALVGLARLHAGPLAALERAEELYRRALTDDPRNPEALEALVGVATRKEQWELVAELSERRFSGVTDVESRFEIAREAARLCLERLRNPQGARLWLRRALELHPDDPATHLALAELERLSGNGAARAGQLAHAAELAGDAVSEATLRELANLALARGDAEAALDPLRGLLERVPGDVAVARRLADTLCSLGRAEELVELLEQRVALAAAVPAECALALVQLGAVHEERFGDDAAALACYERALEAHPDPSAEQALERLYRKREDWPALCDQLARRAAASEGVRAAELHCARGELLLERFAGDESAREAARRAFEAAQGADPGSAGALRGLERIALLSGDELEILDAFEREAALTTDRDRLAFLVWELVRIREAHGEQDEAMHWLERLVAVAPQDLRALEARARLQQQLGLTDELAESLARLDALLPGAARGVNQRRLAELHLASGESERAIEAYRSALVFDAKDQASLAALARLLEASGRIDEFAEIERQRAALLEAPERAACLSRLARLHAERLDDADAALVVLGELVREDALTPADAALLEVLLERHERFEELVERLEVRRSRLDDDSSETRELDRRRAELLHQRLGRPDEAAGILRGLRAEDPESEALCSALEAALRDANDAEGLLELLAERAEAAEDAGEAARLDLERAALLEAIPERCDEARELYAKLAAGEGVRAEKAGRRLDALLERSRDWEALRARLEARLASAPEPVAARERLAALCRDRLRDAAGAIAHLEEAAALAPGRSALWQALAQLYEAADRPRDLLRALRHELELAPEPERALLLHCRAAALCRDALDDPDAAAEHFARVLELDPGNAPAAEFQIGRLEAAGRDAELAELLERRLALVEQPTTPWVEGREMATALRLRIAALRAGPLDDPEGAIRVLEPAAESQASLSMAAEPLAELYLRGGRREALVSLCQRASAASSGPLERSGWSLRLGDALRALGREGAAAEAYRQCLADRPDAGEARLALRELYRRLGETETLARLLEAELARVAGSDEVPLRLELAELLAGGLARPCDALLHLRRVLELEPRQREACEQALALTEALGRHEERLALLEVAVAQGGGRALRAQRLAERAHLQAGPLGRTRDAVASLREALALDPSQAGIRRELRTLLQVLEDWPGVIDCLAGEALRVEPGSRAALYDETARLAEAHLSPDEALPWLERLRAARPGDRETIARIAAVHRAAERPGALLRSLEAELALEPEAERRAALERERAELYETRLGLPGCAAEALASALSARPEDPELLRELARLQAVAGRDRERAATLAALCGVSSGAERIALHGELAALLAERLGLPGQAAEQLWAALAELPPGEIRRGDFLRRLGAALRAAGRIDLWARAAEAELAELPDQEVFRERRRELHRELANAYDRALGMPARALAHWRALVGSAGCEEGAAEQRLRGEAELALLGGLRAAGAHVELERRLAARLERRPEDAEGWLELARLRAERLYRSAAAAEAFRRALALEPERADALRGLREAAEQLGDWAEVARTLEAELALPEQRSPARRAALQRHLGEIAWRRLDATTRASSAFAAALEADPGDLSALRSLEQLFEAMEDWRGALELYASEVEVLGEREPERRQQLWLRVGELARDRLGDPERAVQAYEAAAGLGELALPRRAEWAELHATLGNSARFVEVMASWCDAEGAPVSTDDWLRLAGALEAIGRVDEALERCDTAVRAEPSHAAAWDELARLREQIGDGAGCAAALERGADCRSGSEAAQRRRRAAELLETRTPEQAAALLERAVLDDPADARAYAQLARVSERLGRFGRAQAAAERVLELASPAAGVGASEALEAALAGARAACERGQLDAAERLFAAARAVAPDHAEALAGHGEVLLARGEYEAARRALETRLGLPAEAPERARLLALLGASLQASGDAEAALARYEEARAEDPDLDAAHAGCVGMLERLGRTTEAVAALRGWAGHADSPVPAAARLLRAAELELGREGGEASGEALLAEVVATQRDNGRGWLLLAERLATTRRSEEALDTATRGLAALDERPERAGSSEAKTSALERAGLAEVRATVLEERGEPASAAESYALAARLDPRRGGAALAGARLLRSLGEWQEAARLLRDFANQQRAGDPSCLATALHQLGRLLAGPLEDLDGAVDVYRRALVAQPERSEIRTALAELLAQRPEHWDEALERHRELLEAEPTRVGSLRSVLRIARHREQHDAVAQGLAILVALGVATPEERHAAPERLQASSEPRFANPLWENARAIAQAAADEIGLALGVGARGEGTPRPSGGPLAAFRHAVIEAEGRLTAPALVPLPTAQLAETLTLMAQIALESEGVNGDGKVVNGLCQQLRGRSRRRVRKILEGRIASEFGGIDFEAWRKELRGLAGVAALAVTRAPLRTALLAWPTDDASASPETPPDAADITSLVAASPGARVLLHRIVIDWVGSVRNRAGENS